jgi:L,D-transpeptidase YcbB
MKTTLMAGLALALASGPALAQSAPAKPPVAAKPAQAAVKPATTPEQRSAAALALSSQPVFDDDTFRRIKEALLFYSDIQVRGG